MWWTVPLVGVALYVLLGYNWVWLWKLRKIPGPGWTMPYTGHLAQKLPAFHHYVYLFNWPKQFGPVYKMFMGQLPYVVVTDPHLIEQIGTRQFPKFHDRIPLPIGVRVTDDDKEQFHSNIMWAKGKLWSSVRSACEPLFHTSSLKSYAPLIHESIDQWLALLEKRSAGGATVNIVHPMNGLAMSVLGKANFGIDFDCQSEEQSMLVKSAFYNMDPIDQSEDYIGMLVLFIDMAIPWISGLMTYLIRHGWLNKEGAKTFALMEGYINGTSKALIRNLRRKQAKIDAIGNGAAGGFCSEASEGGSSTKLSKLPYYDQQQLKGQAEGAAAYESAVPKEGSFIPRLLAAKYKLPGQEPKSLTDAQIVAQAYTLILAGYDSPANAMSHTLYELAKNPGAQQRLIAEVDTLKGRQPEYDDLASLVYVEAAFQEALRLHPAGNPMYSPCRVCTADTELGAFKIPKGCGVMLNSVGMAMDPRWFPAPTEYQPERHVPGTPEIGPETRPATAHIPFGFGPHGCVGRRFAIEEAVLTLTRFFQKFSVRLDEKRHPPGSPMWARTGITFQPAGGIWLQLTLRDAAASLPEE